MDDQKRRKKRSIVKTGLLAITYNVHSHCCQSFPQHLIEELAPTPHLGTGIPKSNISTCVDCKGSGHSLVTSLNRYHLPPWTSFYKVMLEISCIEQTRDATDLKQITETICYSEHVKKVRAIVKFLVPIMVN